LVLNLRLWKSNKAINFLNKKTTQRKHVRMSVTKF